jgi:hypothetical protein
MDTNARAHFAAQLDGIRDAGLYKSERLIEGPQDAKVHLCGCSVLNMWPTTTSVTVARRFSRRLVLRSTAGDTGSPQSASSVALNRSIRNLKKGSASSWERKTLFSTHRVLTPTEDYSRLYWEPKMRSSPTS